MIHPHNDSIWSTEDAEYHRAQGRIVGGSRWRRGASTIPNVRSAILRVLRLFCDLVVLEVGELYTLFWFGSSSRWDSNDDAEISTHGFQVCAQKEGVERAMEASLKASVLLAPPAPSLGARENTPTTVGAMRCCRLTDLLTQEKEDPRWSGGLVPTIHLSLVKSTPVPAKHLCDRAAADTR